MSSQGRDRSGSESSAASEGYVLVLTYNHRSLVHRRCSYGYPSSWNLPNLDHGYRVAGFPKFGKIVNTTQLPVHRVKF